MSDPLRLSCGVALLACCTRREPAFEARVKLPESRSAAVAAAAPAAAPAAAATSCAALEVALPAIADGPDDPPVPEIVDADRLATFFDRAARVLRRTAGDHVRIAIYGDSNHTMDFISGRMRRVLQASYGDAGHGFVAVGQPWSHYRHMDVIHGLAASWQSYATTTNPLFDHIYGLSGICATSMQVGARAWIATADESAPIGRSASRFELFFLRSPKSGRIEIRVDGAARSTVDCADPAGPALGREVVQLEDGPHRIEMMALDQRTVRLLGTVLERNGTPSFIIDSFGVGALNSRAHAGEDVDINRAMLIDRGYDLIVFMTGANDVFTLDETPAHLRHLIALQRSALPHASILMVTPPDRGKKTTFPPTLHAVAQRIAIAKETGVGLWDLWRAMGAPGSMAEMKRRGLVYPDYIHFTREGGAWVGDRLSYALWRALARHASHNPRLGCD